MRSQPQPWSQTHPGSTFPRKTQPYARGHWEESQRAKPTPEEMELGVQADPGGSQQQSVFGLLIFITGMKPTSHRLLVIPGGDHGGQRTAWLGVRTARKRAVKYVCVWSQSLAWALHLGSPQLTSNKCSIN